MVQWIHNKTSVNFPIICINEWASFFICPPFWMEWISIWSDGMYGEIALQDSDYGVWVCGYVGV